MKNYLKTDPWHIIEEGFHPEQNRISESIFSIGNGHMGQRGNFEENYSGDSLQGSYMAGVYYPDKTVVGWWKNGYPEYFAKVLNSTNWIGLEIRIDGEILDLNEVEILDFKRDLDMKKGVLKRSYRLRTGSGLEIRGSVSRFTSLDEPEIGVLSYTLECPDKTVDIQVKSYLDGNVRNEDANYQELFWTPLKSSASPRDLYVSMITRKTDFIYSVRCAHKIFMGEKPLDSTPETDEKEGYASHTYGTELSRGSSFRIEKYAACLSSRDYPADSLSSESSRRMDKALESGYELLFNQHTEAWSRRWELSDLTIRGDVSAQQGIRFNIFQMIQTYTGKDERLNIGPKGFTGEKYGGSTYWDTEAYCLPFYLGTADPSIARNLLIYRYKHLERAIENAQKLGFHSGAALYPMVTMNGEECHNEWEITFEEIHRNGAIAYAVWNYINCTGDREYLAQYGLEVLIAIARFWAQRASYSKQKNLYVILGVTGPNEYENNVNNNWYTNTIAAWCMDYVREALSIVREEYPEDYKRIIKKTSYTEAETEQFKSLSENMYYPADEKTGIFLQQDGYLDKEDLSVDDLKSEERPINQNWSWDRILRSCFIKQADVLQGLFFFEDSFSRETIRKNFDYYEPKTVHESSLSSCVHSILAARIGYEEKAYEMYLRTARLDLDDYNNDTEDGCHITSMAGTWMSIIMGFGGLRYRATKLFLDPVLPRAWDSYTFHIIHQGNLLEITVEKQDVCIVNKGEKEISLTLSGLEITVKAGEEKTV